LKSSMDPAGRFLGSTVPGLLSATDRSLAAAPTVRCSPSREIL
jgi:hypothetical protein